jgi:hypothetical protein
MPNPRGWALSRRQLQRPTVTEAIRWLAGTGEEFTADDVVAMSGSPDETHQPNSRNSSIGSAFRHARSEGIIRQTGRYVKSTQPHRKGGVIAVWVGT